MSDREEVKQLKELFLSSFNSDTTTSYWWISIVYSKSSVSSCYCFSYQWAYRSLGSVQWMQNNTDLSLVKFMCFILPLALYFRAFQGLSTSQGPGKPSPMLCQSVEVALISTPSALMRCMKTTRWQLAQNLLICNKTCSLNSRVPTSGRKCFHHLVSHWFHTFLFHMLKI